MLLAQRLLPAVGHSALCTHVVLFPLKRNQSAEEMKTEEVTSTFDWMSIKSFNPTLILSAFVASERNRVPGRERQHLHDPFWRASATSTYLTSPPCKGRGFIHRWGWRGCFSYSFSLIDRPLTVQLQDARCEKLWVMKRLKSSSERLSGISSHLGFTLSGDVQLQSNT